MTAQPMDNARLTMMGITSHMLGFVTFALANILFFVLSFVFLVLAWVLWFFLEAAKGLVGFIEVFASSMYGSYTVSNASFTQ